MEDETPYLIREAEANAYNHGFCRGIATAIVVGTTTGRIVEGEGAALLKQLAAHLSPDMVREVEAGMLELAAHLKAQIEALEGKKPN